MNMPSIAVLEIDRVEQSDRVCRTIVTTIHYNRGNGTVGANSTEKCARPGSQRTLLLNPRRFRLCLSPQIDNMNLFVVGVGSVPNIPRPQRSAQYGFRHPGFV